MLQYNLYSMGDITLKCVCVCERERERVREGERGLRGAPTNQKLAGIHE